MRLGNEPDFLSQLGPKAKSEKKAQDYFTPKVKPKTNIAQTSSLKVAAEKLDIGKPARDANQSRIEGKAKSLTQTKQESEGTLEHFMEAWDMGKYGKATNGEIDDPEREQVRAEAFSLLKDGQRFDAGATALLKDRLNMAKSAGTYLKPGEIGQFKQETLTPEDPEKASEARQKRMREQVDGGVVDWATNDDATFFQDLRDEAEHRLGKFNQEHGVIAQIEKAVGIDPTTEPVNTWLSGAAGKLFATPLNIPAAVEFIGDTSKPMPDRVMATGGLLLDLLGLKLSAEAAVSRVRGSGVPRKAVEEVLATSGKNAPPDVRTRIDELLSEIRKDPPPVTREMEAVQEAELRGRVGASQVEAETSSPLPDDVPTNTQSGTQSGQPPIEPDLPEALRTVDQTAVPSSVELTPPKRTVATVTAEIEEVRARMQSRGQTGRPQTTRRGGAGTKVGAEDIKDAVTLGRLHFERGLRTFDDWAREMVKEFGPAIRTHLQEIWKQSSQPVSGDAVERLQNAIGEAKPLRSDFASKLSAEARSQKAGKLAGAQAKSVGKPMDEAMKRQMGSQKGSFANYSFELPSPIDIDDLAELKDMVLSHPKLRPYDKLNAQLALEKIAGDGQYGGLPTDSELAALERVFGRGIGTQIKKLQSEDFWDAAWNEIMLHRKAGMLSGVRTIIRNFTGNAANAGRTAVLRPVDALMDNIIRFTFPKASQGRTIPWAMAPSVDRTRSVVQKTAIDVAEILKHGQSWEGSAEVLRESRNPLVKYALRFQGVQDSIWMNAAYERSMAEQASVMVRADKSLDFRTLMANPTEAMEAQALLDSQIATFTAPSKLTESLKTLANVPGIGPIVDFLIPFKRVPANIGSEIAQANPFGILVNWGKAIREVRQTGKLSQATQKQLAKQTTNGLLGSGLLALGIDLARRGLLTGASSVDPSQRTTNEALGVRPASLQIGDSRYQLTGTHPMLSVIALGASIYENGQKRAESSAGVAERLAKKGVNPQEFGEGQAETGDLGGLAVALGGIMQEQPFLKGIKDFTDSIQSEHKIHTFVNKAAESFAWNIVPDVQRMVGKGDDVVRDAQNPGEAWRARMGWGTDLPPKYDAFGREVKLGGVFDITNAKEVRTDPVSTLMKQNGLKVTKLERMPNENAKHYEERQKLYGQFLYHVLTQAEPQIAGQDRRVIKQVWESITSKVRSKLEGGLNTEVLKQLPTSQPSAPSQTGG